MSISDEIYEKGYKLLDSTGVVDYDTSYRITFYGFEDNIGIVKNISSNRQMYNSRTDFLIDVNEMMASKDIINLPDVIIKPPQARLGDEVLEFCIANGIRVINVSDTYVNDNTLDINNPAALEQIRSDVFHSRSAKLNKYKEIYFEKIANMVDKLYANDVEKKTDFMMKAILGFFQKMDVSTYSHIRGMLDLIPVMQEGLSSDEKLSESEIRDLERIIIVHDFGKGSIPQSLKGKPGALTLHEREMMAEHVYKKNMGISNAQYLDKYFRSAMLHHVKLNYDEEEFNSREFESVDKKMHKRLTERGYWDEDVFGKNTPQLSKLERMLPIFDAYEALTSSSRSYRQGQDKSAWNAISILNGSKYNEVPGVDIELLDSFVKGLQMSGVDVYEENNSYGGNHVRR